MAIRKKTKAEAESVRAEENSMTGQKSSRIRNTATASPAAATHKSSARKTVKTAPAAEPVASSIVVETPAFEVALYEEEIRTEAYCNWLRNGCPQGSEHQDWIGAIEIVRARYEK